MDCAQKRGTCQRCGGRRCGQARVPINAGLLLFTSRRSPTERSARRRRPAPTLADASHGGAESCAQGRAKCVQACTFVGREPPVRSRIRRRVVWNCRSGRCGHAAVRHATPRPPAAARCTIPRGLLSSRFLNSAARSQAPAAGQHSMLSGSQITSSTPLVQYVSNEDTVTKREFILEPFLHGRYPASLRRRLFLHHHLSPGPEASTGR